jgi:hypothetical protein
MARHAVSRWSIFAACAATCVAAAPALAQSMESLQQPPPTTSNEYLYATQPEGKTLSEGMLRVRLPYKTYDAKTGYDEDGKKVDQPVHLRAAGGAFVAEYGLNSRVSLQMRVDYYTKQQIEFDTADFKNSAVYRQTYDDLYAANLPEAQAQAYGALSQQLHQTVTAETLTPTIKSGVARGLAGKGACGTTSEADCAARIEAGLAAPIELNEANTGLPGLKIPAGTPLKAALEAYSAGVKTQVEKQAADGLAAKLEDEIAAGAKSKYQKDGAVGLGDTTLGVLYEVLSTAPAYLSLGGGVRFPTGKCASLGFAELPTSRCVTEAGLRSNVDLLPVDWFMLSWQNQAEAMVVKGKMDNGDKKVDVKRKGVRNVGFVYLKPSLVPISRALNVLAPRIGATYDYDSGKVVDGKAAPRSNQENMLYGIGIDLTRFGLPFQFDYEHEEPFRGRDVALASKTNFYSLKAYYIF